MYNLDPRAQPFVPRNKSPIVFHQNRRASSCPPVKVEPREVPLTHSLSSISLVEKPDISKMYREEELKTLMRSMAGGARLCPICRYNISEYVSNGKITDSIHSCLDQVYQPSFSVKGDVKGVVKENKAPGFHLPMQMPRTYHHGSYPMARSRNRRRIPY